VEINELIDRLVKFRDERNWARFHTVKDLALSVSIEASELLELTQWKTSPDVEVLAKGPLRKEFTDEIADVCIYLLLLCDKLAIDPVAAMHQKIEANELRFPKDEGGERGT
jgi:NTP pyrophosphatase (non-canonical NTP hydrolase)